MKIHPSEEVLADLLRPLGEGDPRMLRHLLECEPCRSRLAGLSRCGDPVPAVPVRPAGAVEYDRAFELSWQAVAGWARALERERGRRRVSTPS